MRLGAFLRLLRAILCLAVPLVVLPACGGSEDQAPPTVAPAAGGERQSPASPTTTPPAATPTAEPAAVEAVRRELADRLGVAASRLKAVSVEPVAWPDASLGCPQEGYAYAQVVTPGYRVVMEHDGQRYTYHTNATASLVVTC